MTINISGLQLKNLTLSTPVTDPYWANVTLLMHFDGANASTTFTDVKGKVLTTVGNAQLSTSQFKYGTASGLFDGSGDYLIAAVSGGAGNTAFTFGAANFTIELWVRPTAFSSSSTIASNRAIVGSDYNWDLALGNGSAFFQAWGPGAGSSLVAFGTPASVIPLNQWTHLAVVRNGSFFYIYIGGVLQATSLNTSLSMADNTSLNLYIGKDPAFTGRDFIGYMDDFRITKGVARYTSNFTPPTSPFPNS